VENQDTGYKIAMKEKKGLPNNPGGVLGETLQWLEESRTGDKTSKSKRSIWMKKKQRLNRRETTTVPSKKWSEGQTGTKTHYH